MEQMGTFLDQTNHRIDWDNEMAIMAALDGWLASTDDITSVSHCVKQMSSLACKV
jgi:hypothetical protein